MNIAYGCGIIVYDKDKRILFGQRQDGQGLCIAGGKLEPGESSRLAAAREVKEEFGLTGRLRFLGSIVSTAIVRQIPSIVISDIFELYTPSKVQEPDDELNNFVWYTLEDALSKELFAPTRQALLCLYTGVWGRRESFNEETKQAQRKE